MHAPQQIELEEKITLIQELDAERGDDDDLNTNARECYREFTNTLKNWHIENMQLSSAFGTKVGLLLCLWHYLVHATPVLFSILKY